MEKTKRPKTDEKLESETLKWLAKLEEKLKVSKLEPESPIEKKVLQNSMDNVNAYIKDCRHFLNQKDYVNAFEAIIYAWGILDTLERMNMIVKK